MDDLLKVFVSTELQTIIYDEISEGLQVSFHQHGQQKQLKSILSENDRKSVIEG